AARLEEPWRRRKHVDFVASLILPPLRFALIRLPSVLGEERLDLVGLGDNGEVDIARSPSERNVMIESHGTDDDEARLLRAAESHEEACMRGRDVEGHLENSLSR